MKCCSYCVHKRICHLVSNKGKDEKSLCDKQTECVHEQDISTCNLYKYFRCKFCRTYNFKDLYSFKMDYSPKNVFPYWIIQLIIFLICWLQVCNVNAWSLLTCQQTTCTYSFRLCILEIRMYSFIPSYDLLIFYKKLQFF